MPHAWEEAEQAENAAADAAQSVRGDGRLGFVLVHDPAKVQQWLVQHARVCAEDYFARVRAPLGEWVVHVYRILDDEWWHMVSIRMHWDGHEGASRGSPSASAK